MTCKHKRKIKVHEWHHPAMGPESEAWWCPDCGGLRKMWEKRWRKPSKAKGGGA